MKASLKAAVEQIKATGALFLFSRVITHSLFLVVSRDIYNVCLTVASLFKKTLIYPATILTLLIVRIGISNLKQKKRSALKATLHRPSARHILPLERSARPFPSRRPRMRTGGGGATLRFGR